MEFVKSFGKGLLQGGAVGGASIVITKKYDDMVSEGTHPALRVVADLLVYLGSVYVGLRGARAIDKFLEKEEEVDME